MKFLPTPEFSEKLGSVANLTRMAVLDAITKINDLTSENFLQGDLGIGIKSLPEDIYAIEKGNVTLIASGAVVEDEPVLLLMDIIETGRETYRHESSTSARDPRRRSELNPLVNTRLNPNVNSRLNPRVNTRLNPIVNTRINPNVNSRINPVVNSRLNPVVNSRLNPAVNTRLNPRVNSNINPWVNTLFDGPFLYDKSMARAGFFVKADEDVMLFFEMDSTFGGIAVKYDEGYALFSRQNEWIGYLVQADSGVLLRFDKRNNWVGTVV